MLKSAPPEVCLTGRHRSLVMSALYCEAMSRGKKLLDRAHYLVHTPGLIRRGGGGGGGGVD